MYKRQVRGNVRTSSIARWKARGRLLIRDIDPNELVLTYGGLHLCVKFGENRQRNATVRVMTYGQTHRHTDRQTDANRFCYLSHAICYSYGTDNQLI